MSRKPRFNDEKYKQLIEEAYEGKITVLGKYTKQSDKILHRCEKCLTEWKVPPTKLLTPTGKKKATFGCPSCCKGVPTYQAMTESEFKLKLKRRLWGDGFKHTSFKLKSEYRGINVHVTVQCQECNKEFSIRPKALLNKKYMCLCKTPSSIESISKAESKKCAKLYKVAKLNFFEISKITGRPEKLLRDVAERDGWIDKVRNSHKSQRNARQRLLNERFYDVDKKHYNRQARRITAIIYEKYKHIIDPKNKRGPKFALDHMFSIHEAYVRGPVDLRYICHPANLQIVPARDNLEKRTKSVGVETLKQRIRDFHKVHGKVEFPENYLYKYKSEKQELNIVNGVSVLGFDPGKENFGCFAGILNGIGTLQSCETYESAMLVHTMDDVKTFNVDLFRFTNEIKSYIDVYEPDIITVERFMSRGLKGTTIELVNMMIGAISAIVLEYETKGIHIKMDIISSAMWKNQVNRVTSLDSIYQKARKLNIPDHRIDAMLISWYNYPGTNPYAILKNNKMVDYILNQLI